MEKREFFVDKIEVQFAVIGAGMAGISAAISAAREGKKVALVTDRSILGGSASSEIRVGPGGADYSSHTRYAKETGIVEEIFNHIFYRAQNAGKWRWFYFDQVYFDLVYNEPNIQLFLNTYIDTVEKNGDKIISVEGNQSRAEKRIKITADYFADCSGDGTVGYLSGCEYKIGAEAIDEFKETYAPKVANSRTMGATLLFTSVDAGHKTDFICPEWAIKIEGLPSEYRISKSIRTMPDGSYYGFWWVEYGGQLDSIHDDQKINEHLRKLVYGIWDYIKNSGNFPDSWAQELNWIGYLSGKRESRRLMGQYIINSNDLFSQRTFEDAVTFTGWPVDVHEPEGYLSKGDGYTHYWLPGIADVPLRALISKDISNLFYAGRQISCTREALGSLRLISTTATMGQAIGISASMCIENKIDPTALAKSYIPQLQSRLLMRDQSITGKTVFGKNDISRTAKVSVSSVAAFEAVSADTFRYLNNSTGLILPVESLEEISFYLGAEGSQKAMLDIYECDPRPQNYRVKKLLKSLNLIIEKNGWYTFKTDIEKTSGKIFVMIKKNDKLKVYMEKRHLCGIVAFETSFESLVYETPFAVLGNESETPLIPCFKVNPQPLMYGGENLINGHIRPYGKPNMWMSSQMKSEKPEYALYEFKATGLKSVEIVFNSDLNSKRLKPVISKVNPEMVKDYDVYIRCDNVWKCVISQKNNFKRFVRHDLKGITADALKVTINSTWGSPSAEIFDIRIIKDEGI